MRIGFALVALNEVQESWWQTFHPKSIVPLNRHLSLEAPLWNRTAFLQATFRSSDNFYCWCISFWRQCLLSRLKVLYYSTWRPLRDHFNRLSLVDILGHVFVLLYVLFPTTWQVEGRAWHIWEIAHRPKWGYSFSEWACGALETWRTCWTRRPWIAQG